MDILPVSRGLLTRPAGGLRSVSLGGSSDIVKGEGRLAWDARCETPVTNRGTKLGAKPGRNLGRRAPVPGERFELPTNGLQNRCSTTELTRLAAGMGTALAPPRGSVNTDLLGPLAFPKQARPDAPRELLGADHQG